MEADELFDVEVVPEEVLGVIEPVVPDELLNEDD